MYSNQIDAMVYTVGHPSGSIQEATTACDSVLVEVSGSAVDGLVDDNSFYRTATIPGGMYRGNDSDTMTFGVGATFVTSANVSDDVVYTLVSSVFENFEGGAENLKSLVPTVGIVVRQASALTH